MPRSPRSRFFRARVAIGAVAVATLAATWIALRHSAPAPVASPVIATGPRPAAAPLAPPPPREPVAPPKPATTPRARPPASEFTALLEWSARYLASAGADRDQLVPEGVALARARRPVLAALIRSDPEAALAAALPRSVRAQLPAEVVAELEQLVSARAELAVIHRCFHPPGAAHAPGDDLYRATVIDGREYRAHVYGSRLRDASLPATSLHGIALDGHLAVDEARFRVLGAGEDGSASAPHGSLAVEADGAVTLLPSPAALPDFAQALLATEQNPVVNEADSGAGSGNVTGRPTQAWTHGAKTLLVIRVDFSDLPGAPVNKFDTNAEITPAYLDTVINGAGGVRAFIQAGSYGKADLLFDPASDATGVLRLPRTASHYATGDGVDGYNSLLHSDARSAATTAGFNVSAYDRVAVVFTNLGSQSGSKITYGGLGNVIGPNLWVNGEFDLRVVGHELGHNYGLRHANLWKVTDGDPVSLATGSSADYGDPFDLMGDGDFLENDFSHWNKSLLQWIPDSAVTVATSSGTYRVHRFDAAAADLAAPRALKVVRDATRDYWIGYRRGLASSATDNGAYVLWGYNTSAAGNLLDLVTPGSGAADAPLPLDMTFHDAAAGVSLRPVAQGGSDTDEWLDVEVSLQPRIQWTAPNYVVNEQGATAVLTATRTANSAGEVSVSYATAPGTATADADYAPAAGTLVWPDGDTSPKTIAIPLVADELVEGTETFTVLLAAPVGGVVVEPAATTVTIADPGARDPAFAATFINNAIYRAVPQPDGKILVAGPFSLLRDRNQAIVAAGRVARLDEQGLHDPEFAPGSGADATIFALARQTDGKILVGGNFTSFDGVAINRIVRLNTDGSLDAGFNPGSGADGEIRDILALPDGGILVAGAFTTYDGAARNGLVRLLPDGSRDPAFADVAGPVMFYIRALALQADGRILAGGAFYHSTGALRAGLMRLNADGTADASFTGLAGGAAKAFTPEYLGTVDQLSVLPDGRILVVGDFSQFNGEARFGIARLTSTGALDPGFAPALNAPAGALLVLPDGSALVGGNFTAINGVAADRIARIGSDGAPDTAFAAAGGSSTVVEDLALLPDGKVLLTRQITFSSERPIWRIVPGLSGAPGVVQFVADAFQGSEGSSAVLSVTRTGGSLGDLIVGYATVVGTALAGDDFNATAGVLAWADGDASAKTISVPLALDAVAESPETFMVNLGAPLIGGALLGDRQQATVTVASAFANWRAARFTPAELANPAISGDAADPDGDGLNNLAEFAFDLAPEAPDSAAAWTTAIQNVSGEDYLTITFRRRAPALDLAYVVQASADLSTPDGWAATAVQVGAAIANGDGTETVTYRDSVATGAATRRFLRVHVTRTP